ncbi:MAG TPA: hypothetical protein VF481_18885 [Novosphingobium sp.]
MKRALPDFERFAAKTKRRSATLRNQEDPDVQRGRAREALAILEWLALEASTAFASNRPDIGDDYSTGRPGGT